MSVHPEPRTDLLVIGAGLAGLSAALTAAERGADVTLVTKGSVRASNSFMAQGGIAAAVGPGDGPEQHAADTLLAGRGLADPAAVGVLVSDGVRRIADLERWGVAFTGSPGADMRWAGRAGTAGAGSCTPAAAPPAPPSPTP